MKVSVIVPSYKFSTYIEQCIYSILSQKTNFDFEILVRDDFSQDGTDEILDYISYFNTNIKYYKSTENWGGYENIKFLISQCSGEYIAYIDGDDFWTDNKKLQKQVDFFDSNPDYILSFTGHWNLNPNGISYPHPGWLGYIYTHEITTENLIVNNNVAYGKMFRNVKDIVKDYFKELPYFDWPLCFELSLLGKIKYLDFPSGMYRIHGKGDMTSLTIEQKIKNKDIISDKLKSIYYELK